MIQDPYADDAQLEELRKDNAVHGLYNTLLTILTSGAEEGGLFGKKMLVSDQEKAMLERIRQALNL